MRICRSLRRGEVARRTSNSVGLIFFTPSAQKLTSESGAPLSIGQVKIADRPRPIAAGGQHIGDAPLEKGALAVSGGSAAALAGAGDKILVDAIERRVALQILGVDGQGEPSIVPSSPTLGR